jgi:hypothetical protein
MEELTGRKEFSEEDYQENDPVGKAKAMKILAHAKLFTPDIYRILSPIEDMQCGDVKIKFSEDDSITAYEIENAGYDRFEINFKGGYPTVNVPMKNLRSIPDGYFMAVDGGESEHIDIPKRFYIVEVKYVLASPVAANVNRKSNGKKEKFYKVPSHLVKRYQWNEKKGKYIRVYP